ncbi:mediator complex subunit Med5-domain-containing protein [Chlamydoabsidia padenii]|nr:mediator complex subunit Med5-domain-containing protein [Chlamydoabsidia padenii]
MTTYALEKVLEYAYFNGYNCIQWEQPIRQCLEQSDQDSSPALCDLLLKHFFSTSRTHSMLIESYMTFALTGGSTKGLDIGDTLIQGKLFVSRLVNRDIRFASNPKYTYQWTCLLRLLPSLLVDVDGDRKEHLTLAPMLARLLIILSHLVAVGLYQKASPNDNDEEETTTKQDSSHMSLTNNTTQLAMVSQSTLDLDATLDATLIDDVKLARANVPVAATTNVDTLLQQDPLQHPLERRNSLEWENAVSAAKLIIDLIEKKGLKRIIEKYNQGHIGGEHEHSDTNDPWVTCHSILMPSKSTSVLSKPTTLSTADTHNVYIQKLLLLIERLTDRDLERRLAVHMKYHELEDEGTARAMPSAGLMGLVYHMVQICPTLDDNELVNRLVKLQAIKGSFDESFYLELWFAALTGLREASLSTSCQNITPSGQHDNQTNNKNCNTTVATNRLLWKNLVLVKLPHLIHRFQERKEKEELTRHSLKRDLYRKSPQSRKDDESNAIESSLIELKTFTGLLNACNPPACCPEFYVPSSKSTNLVNRFAFGEQQQHMIDDYDTFTDFNTPAFIKAIQSISTNDIFTDIIHSCQPYHFLSGNKIRDNVKLDDESKFEQDNSCDDVPDCGGDDDKMDVDRQTDMDNAITEIDQNINQRMNAIQSNATKASIMELIHIGLISLTHWRKIVEFLLMLLHDKAQAGDVRTLYRFCGALNDCPAAIDLILQMHSPTVLLSPLEMICNEWNPSDDYMDVDDGASGSNDHDDDDYMDGIQNWYHKFGNIWIFVLVVASKFDITSVIDTIFKEKNGLCYQFFVTGPIIYGVHAHDQEMEHLVGQWLSAMGGDGISDDLLRTTKLQMLLRGTPTIIDRLLCIYDAGRIETETFNGVLSYFRKRFLHFVLVPGVIHVLCDELLNRNASSALTCLTHLVSALPDTLIHLCASTVLGSLGVWKESQQQYKKLRVPTSKDQDQDQEITRLEQCFITTLDVGMNNKQPMIGVNRRTLMEKSREMFRYIVKSGRSMYMNNVDGDARNLWAVNGKWPQQVVSHYLDLVMFQSALKMHGARWFICMIVDEVLEAGKSGGAVRAAELGSCLLTTPLIYNTSSTSACLAMLRCLLQDVIPSSIKDCSTKNTSFFQGQTVGVFVSDCLVLMYQEPNDTIDTLGCDFFDALVIDRVRGGEVPQLVVPRPSKDGSRFGVWDEEVVNSPVWRGFVKGLMSNPFIKEMWPNAYAS